MNISRTKAGRLVFEPVDSVEFDLLEWIYDHIPAEHSGVDLDADEKRIILTIRRSRL